MGAVALERGPRFRPFAYVANSIREGRVGSALRQFGAGLLTAFIAACFLLPETALTLEMGFALTNLLRAGFISLSTGYLVGLFEK